jgi:acyl-CoA thioesterase II
MAESYGPGDVTSTSGDNALTGPWCRRTTVIGMDAKTFLGMEPTHNPFRFHLPVKQGLATGSGFLFGGAGLGAAVEALETVSQRPVVWATCQYLSYALVGSVVDLDVKIAVNGHNVTQARVTGHVADQEIFTVNAAMGLRDMPGEGQFAVRPPAPAPLDCPVRVSRGESDHSIHTHVEMRTVQVRDENTFRNDGVAEPSVDGRSIVWARVRDLEQVSTMSLAIMGDWVPFGVSQAMGARGGGNSLDNTLRVVQLVPTDWVLLDIRVQAVRNGFGHGLVHQWAEDGTLLATASQSVIVRHRDADGNRLQRR